MECSVPLDICILEWVGRSTRLILRVANFFLLRPYVVSVVPWDDCFHNTNH
jgi:hypothetical protein